MASTFPELAMFGYGPFLSAFAALLLHVWQDIGYGRGKYYSVNFPLREGMDDFSYQSIFEPVCRQLPTHSLRWFSLGVTAFSLAARSSDTWWSGISQRPS